MGKGTDNVNSPSHYTAGKVECIDALEAATVGLEGLEAICTGNVIKYLWRWKHKNGVEDLKKARWYLNRLIVSLDQTKSARQDETTDADTLPHPFLGPDRTYVKSDHPDLMYIYEDGTLVGYYSPGGLSEEDDRRLTELIRILPNRDPEAIIWTLAHALVK